MALSYRLAWIRSQCPAAVSGDGDCRSRKERLSTSTAAHPAARAGGQTKISSHRPGQSAAVVRMLPLSGGRSTSPPSQDRSHGGDNGHPPQTHQAPAGQPPIAGEKRNVGQQPMTAPFAPPVSPYGHRRQWRYPACLRVVPDFLGRVALQHCKPIARRLEPTVREPNTRSLYMILRKILLVASAAALMSTPAWALPSQTPSSQGTDHAPSTTPVGPPNTTPNNTEDPGAANRSSQNGNNRRQRSGPQRQPGLQPSQRQPPRPVAQVQAAQCRICGIGYARQPDADEERRRHLQRYAGSGSHPHQPSRQGRKDHLQPCRKYTSRSASPTSTTTATSARRPGEGRPGEGDRQDPRLWPRSATRADSQQKRTIRKIVFHAPPK